MASRQRILNQRECRFRNQRLDRTTLTFSTTWWLSRTEYPALRTRTPSTWSSARRLRTPDRPPAASRARTGISIDLPTTQVIPRAAAAATPPAM